MIPDKLPPDTNRGEADMFRRIRDSEKSSEYVCLHSLGLSRHQRKEYAEADFVVIGPPGVFCLEVKGGQVSRSNGIWTIGWPGSEYQTTEGPFAQSQRTRYPLRSYLQERLGLKPYDVLFGWGVAFPHIIFDRRAPEWDQDVIYDQRDQGTSFVSYIEKLERYFRRRLTETEKPQPPQLSATRIAQILDCLRGDFDVVQTVKGLLEDSRRELVELSKAQFAVLDFALTDRNPRIICNGGAGTGKTLIAIEAARRLSAEGKKVLLLCYNVQLGRFLAADALETARRVKTSTVYSFMAEVIRSGGFGSQLAPTGMRPDEFFAKVYPDLFESAASVLLDHDELPQFDVIIIDEAQDILNAPVMDCLALVLDKGFTRGCWLIFLDSGPQSAVYGRMDAEALNTLRQASPAEFSLSENFRNPKAIISEMCTISGIEQPMCRRQMHSNVDYRVYDTDKQEAQKLRAILVELMREGVLPGDITILSGAARSAACISRHPPDVGKEICFIEDVRQRCPPTAISAASVSGFKGLENEIIILTDLPKIDSTNDWARSIIYVGMTRARSKLYALVDRSFIDARSRYE